MGHNYPRMHLNTFLVASKMIKACEKNLKENEWFLDGRVVEMPLEGECKYNLTLKHHLFVGKEIIQHVQATVWYSANHMQRARVLGYFQEEEVQKQMEKVVSTTSLNQENADDSDDISVQLAKSSHIGNCLEMALLGYRYAKKQFPYCLVEVFCIHEGDHVFLVIGRDAGLKPSAYKFWGLDAVVCDPWSGACYPAVNIDEFLLDLKGVDCSQEISVPVVAPFDATYQSLEFFKCNFQDENR